MTKHSPDHLHLHLRELGWSVVAQPPKLLHKGFVFSGLASSELYASWCEGKEEVRLLKKRDESLWEKGDHSGARFDLCTVYGHIHQQLFQMSWSGNMSCDVVWWWWCQPKPSGGHLGWMESWQTMAEWEGEIGIFCTDGHCTVWPSFSLFILHPTSLSFCLLVHFTQYRTLNTVAVPSSFL